VDVIVSNIAIEANIEKGLCKEIFGFPILDCGI